MRIIAGEKRGMNLMSPKGDTSRPITDRVKESLFSIIYKYDLPAGKIVADLFCGVGSVGLEAISRGAEYAAFVERDYDVAQVLRKNIEKAGFAAKSKVIQADAFKVGAPVDFDKPKYDFIMVDPPFRLSKDTAEGSELGKLMNLLAQQAKNGSIIVVRTQKDVQLLEQYGVFKVIDRRQWGINAVTILKNDQ